jgi:hypothetical protein
MKRTPANAHTIQRVQCPICSCIEQVEGTKQEAAETLKKGGWHYSSQISESDNEWHLVCPAHYETPNSRTILNHAEEDPRPLNLPLIS